MHLFVDNLTNVDFSYLDPERGVVGETWLASISLDGALDEQGMVCDFGIVKKTVRHWLDTYIDHCLAAPKDSQALTIKRADATISDIEWRYKRQDGEESRTKEGQTIYCQSPAQAISFVDGEAITPETVSAWCIKQLRPLLPDTIDKIHLSFEPEIIPHHFYHYSHGLKKHNGNCQRIAHGHRSTIQILIDGQRNHSAEQNWCKQWEDIYIGTQSDLVEEKHIGDVAYYHFAYQAPQGHFELTIPKQHCYLIDTESTVEFIAQHIANALKKADPSKTFRVRAYEGIGKGAIAEA